MTDTAPLGRRLFGPVVLLGLGSAALAAVAGTKAWAVPGDPGGERLGIAIPAHALDQESPLGAAVALVVLATWGTLLVTRGRVRRSLAVVGLLAAVGLLVTVIEAYSSLQDAVRAELADHGLSGDELDRASSAIEMTGWWGVALVATALSILALVAAVVWCRSWPEMGSRYDAPGGAAHDSTEPAEQSNLDLWKSLDEGHDPTA